MIDATSNACEIQDALHRAQGPVNRLAPHAPRLTRLVEQVNALDALSKRHDEALEQIGRLVTKECPDGKTNILSIKSYP